MALYIGLDLGTQGAKAVIYDSSKRSIVSRGAVSYGIIESKVPGRAEQAPSTWVESSVAAIKQALHGVNVAQVKAIGVSGQQHGLVVLDDDGQVLRNAKLWCDTESAPEAEELSRQLGHTVVPSFTATKLLWLKRHEPDVFKRVAHVLLPHDYLNLWLTGRYCMEAGDASGTGVFDVRQRCWDRKAMELVDPSLHSWLPELIGPDEVLGTLHAEAAGQLGLGTDVVVAPGSGDNAMSALGSGVVRSGELVVSLGTSGTIFGKSDIPIWDPTCTVCPFCDATGAWLPLVCTLNCTRPAEDVRAGFGLSFDEAAALAAAAPAGCEGLLCLPYLAGERTPNYPTSCGVLHGLRPGSLAAPGLLYRAALEGATLSLLVGLRRMTALGLVAREVKLVGGGAKSALWQQIVADVFQLPVQLPEEPESAALGAALQAGAVHSGRPVAEFVSDHAPPISGKTVLPNPDNADVYAEAYERFVQLGATLFGGGAAAGAAPETAASGGAVQAAAS